MAQSNSRWNLGSGPPAKDLGPRLNGDIRDFVSVVVVVVLIAAVIIVVAVAAAVVLLLLVVLAVPPIKHAGLASARSRSLQDADAAQPDTVAQGLRKPEHPQWDPNHLPTWQGRQNVTISLP